jgi:hypothetical protein
MVFAFLSRIDLLRYWNVSFFWDSYSSENSVLETQNIKEEHVRYE